MTYPLSKLIALAEAARHVQQDENFQTVRWLDGLVSQLLTFEKHPPPSASTPDVEMRLVAESTRDSNSTNRLWLSPEDSLVFEFEDGAETFSVHRRKHADGLVMEGDVSGQFNESSMVYLFQSEILVDASVIDENGDFVLEALNYGTCVLKLVLDGNARVYRSEFELAP